MSDPATTWWFVRIQPFESKMTPDPMPSWGREPRSFGFTPAVEVIWTTAGPALAAASMIAEDSSKRPLWVVGTEDVVVPWPAGALATDRSSAPLASMARTVPPEATTAAPMATAAIGELQPGAPLSRGRDYRCRRMLEPAARGRARPVPVRAVRSQSDVGWGAGE